MEQVTIRGTGIVVKVGDKVAVTNWLTFVYTVVSIPSNNKFVCQDGFGNRVVLTKGYKYWKAHGIEKVRVEFNPDLKKVEEHNERIENSETWMCM